MRRALVIGASSGVGTACVHRLLAKGFEVVAGSRTPGATPEGASWFQVDMTYAEEAPCRIRSVIGSELDVLVYATGYFPSRRNISEVSWPEWQRSLDVNLTGAFLAARESMPALSMRCGTAVFIGSVYSHAGLRWGASYSAAKHGLLGLADTINQEFEDHGVRAVVISPGVIATPMAGQHTDEGLPATDIARTLEFLIDLDPRSLVREVVIERSRVARLDREVQETAPAWLTHIAGPIADA